MKHNLEYWLEEENLELQNTSPGDELNSTLDAQSNDAEAGEGQPEQPEQQGDQQEPEQPEQDVTQDPEAPDMPEEGNEENNDFEVWKSNYFKESIKGDANKMMELISPMRARDEMAPYQRKFVEDNWNIQLLRMNSNITDASKQIRKSIREQLDKNNPATSVVNHIVSSLETTPALKDTFIRMMGYSGNKGELHRKFIAALTGSVQVSSSPDKENIIFNEKEYSIKMATRLNSEWGEVSIGSWSLREDDPERYLSEPEVKRLSEGSPQERDVLRRRVVIESIAKHFEEQAFIINVVNEDGTIYYLGWDIANALRGAYAEGKIVVKTMKSENSEAMISDDGQIVPMIDLRIYFVKEGIGQDEEGNPEVEEVEFMQKRNGMLFLTAGLSTIKDAAEAMQGTEFKEITYAGNPSDLKVLKRCVYSVHDLLMRQC
jgi:hypothetical protein